MKILSDFDGVWTDQAFEAQSVQLWMEAEAARLAGVSPDRARAEFAEFEVAVRARPGDFGWAPDGRITAYVDEDPFCSTNALAAYLAETEDPRAQPYRDGILAAGFADLTAFADDCFHRGVAAFRRDHPAAIVEHAGEVLARLHAVEVEVVVVSNSPVEKIAAWFAAVGVDAGPDAGHDLRVIGEAGKQVLGERGDTRAFGGRTIHVDRPRYRAILEREHPDLVIGDVFSLDLALPHVVREEGGAGAPSQLVLRSHPHTPDWVRSLGRGGPIDHVVDDVSHLVAIASTTAPRAR